ncbi:hypothetical protein QP731_11710 [Sphingomonas sp. UMB7805-LC452B]|nr:hypothetical protein [Sphingomonas sp. UMB7805-LC452B]
MQQADRAHSATGTHASPGNENEISASRRGLMLGVVAMTALASVPAVAAPTAFQRAVVKNQSAEARFNALPADLELRDPAVHTAQEDALLLAWNGVVRAVPTDWQEFARKFALLAEEDGEAMTAENAVALLADCRRLLERGA